MGTEQIIVFEVAVPAIYTADLEDLREYKGEFESESEWLLNCIGSPGPTCRLRVETTGEKEGSVQEVWGLVRGARLVDPEPSETEDEIARLHSDALLRDEGSCEWCDYDSNCLEVGGPDAS